MKIVVTADGTDLDAQVDPRFGRSRYFLAVDTQDDSVTHHDNQQNLNAVQGAGIQAGQNVVQLGAEAVITGNVGPKAFSVLSAAGIKIFLVDGGTVKEAVEKFKAGSLQQVDGASKPGHWI